MRFYTKNHAHYCGIDLHAKTMYLLVGNFADSDSGNEPSLLKRFDGVDSRFELGRGKHALAVDGPHVVLRCCPTFQGVAVMA